MQKRKLVFKRENLLKPKVPNKPGLYKFYDKKGRMIYVGHASRLRHRVQSYHQKDDFREHPTKPVLRKHIHKYEYHVMPKKIAQEKERKQKKNGKFNFL
jgi:excinuclease ABC subunit C